MHGDNPDMVNAEWILKCRGLCIEAFKLTRVNLSR